MGRPRAQHATRTRTFAVVGHTGAGKTQLVEAMLHVAGAVRSPGRVEQGTALLDFDPEERDRHGTAFPGVAWLAWGDTTLHLVDTPGHDAAAYPTALARAGTDADLLVVGGGDGVEGVAEDVLRRARHADRALLVVVTKLDRPADLDALLGRMAELARRPVLALQRPVYEGGVLVGLLDLVEERLLRFDPEGSGALSAEPVPAPRAAELGAAREALLEAVAVTDEGLLEAYLEHLDLPPDAVWAGLAAAAQQGLVVPVLLSAALAQVGTAPLLDAMVGLSPDPRDWVLPADAERTPGVVAQWVATYLDEDGAQVAVLRVWQGELADQARVCVDGGGAVRLSKLYQVRGPRRARAHDRGPGALVATWDALPGGPGSVITDGARVPLLPPPARPSMAWFDLHPRGAGGARALEEALAWARRVDPSLQVLSQPGDAVARLAGGTRRQLELAVQRIRQRLGVLVDVRPPRVAYRERPLRHARGVGVHRGICDGEDTLLGEIEVEVTPGVEGWRFEAEVDEDLLPQRFLPPAADGVREGLLHGPRGGFPVDGLVVRCTGGEYDALESTSEHFVEAGRQAVIAALHESGTELLEPWSQLRLCAPREEVGAVLAELAAHRGRVHDVQVGDDEVEVQVDCPEQLLPSLGSRLEATTRGRGWFLARAGFYERVDDAAAAEVVAREARPCDAAGSDPTVETTAGRSTRGGSASRSSRTSRRVVPT